MSLKPNDEFRAALISSLGQEAILKGTAYTGHGAEFLFAVEAAEKPTLIVDGEPAAEMRRIKGWNLWFATAQLETGRSHSFHYQIEGRTKGGDPDIPAYPPESYAESGAPQGMLSEKLVHTSKIYAGMTTEYWIYVPAGYDPGSPAAVMVWQDGQDHTDRDGPAKTLNVVDNLIHQKKMPVTVLVLVAPGKTGDRPMRGLQYEAIDDVYGRFLREELLPEVQARYSIRTDAASCAIAGVGSGGLCAFNAAWQMPDQFSRVLSIIGSFTSVGWESGAKEAGHVYPFKVRQEAVRNIRVWLQSGTGDLEDQHGSWPLQNIQLANSLKLKGYDFHLSFGNGGHSPAHGYAELPESLAWLWRGYDAAQPQQIFAIDPDERKAPLFRVRISNR